MIRDKLALTVFGVLERTYSAAVDLRNPSFKPPRWPAAPTDPVENAYPRWEPLAPDPAVPLNDVDVPNRLRSPRFVSYEVVDRASEV